MAACRQVYDSRHLQADYQEPGSTPEPYSSGTLRSAIEYWLPLLFLLLTIYVISEKKTICNPLAYSTWKCTRLTCDVPNFFYPTEGLHCTCIFRTCVFHPCGFVLAFSVHAFSSTCVFSAPVSTRYWHCLHCMPSRVYVTVRRPSVRLSVPAWIHSSKPAAVGLLLWARRAGDPSNSISFHVV